MLTSSRSRRLLSSRLASIFFAIAILTLTSGPLYAEPVESADVIPTVLSESDQLLLSKEKAKLDELRKGLLDDIAQQNTECGQVAESNTFQVDLCQNRKEFLLSQIQNYKSRLADYRAKIQKALFMAPQGKVAVQSGLVFKDIPPPTSLKEPATNVEINKDAQRIIDYVNNPENNPRVKRAKDEADRFHGLHEAASQGLIDEVNRTIADVRAKTVSNNPHLGREEVDRIVSQDPEVRRLSATWYLVHSQTERQAKDYEEDYENISKEAAKEIDRKREMK